MKLTSDFLRLPVRQGLPTKLTSGTEAKHLADLGKKIATYFRLFHPFLELSSTWLTLVLSPSSRRVRLAGETADARTQRATLRLRAYFLSNTLRGFGNNLAGELYNVF